MSCCVCAAGRGSASVPGPLHLADERHIPLISLLLCAAQRLLLCPVICSAQPQLSKHCLFLSLSLPLHFIFIFLFAHSTSLISFWPWWIICLLFFTVHQLADTVPSIDPNWASIDQPLTGTIDSSPFWRSGCGVLVWQSLSLWCGDAECAVVRMIMWLGRGQAPWGLFKGKKKNKTWQLCLICFAFF